MCGIFGFIHREQIPNLKQIEVETILSHRGPDDVGWLLSDGKEVQTGKSALPINNAKLFLLHKRLSILDLTEVAWQPMRCENNRYYLFFNGEIYNYVELKEELQNVGFHFTSKSDSEVLLKAYVHWGKECLKKLVGMFAFVIFDKKDNKIFIARDPFGIKPFYYYHANDSFLFASEIKTLLSFIPKRELNRHRIFHYLRSGLTDFTDETLFADIKQLPPGHYMEFDNLKFTNGQPIQYWQPMLETNKQITFHEAAHTLKTLFLENVSLHLRSDVQVAATLSGGIDSSSIVMCIRHLFPHLDIHTFSYIADEQSLNEEKWIDIVNQEAGAISHKVFANPHNLIADLEQLIAIQDEPFGSTSIYAQHRVFQAAGKQKIKVMLDGQGADEMLGGYSFYLIARFVSLLKQFNFRKAFELLRHTGYSLPLLTRTFHYLFPHSLNKHFRKFTQPYIPRWLNSAWFSSHNDYFAPFKTHYGKQVLQEELLHNFTHSSLPMLLRYEDRNSMAYSIESRVPFLTTKLVEFIFSLPEEFIISRNGLSKAVFREAMKGLVPEAILQRRDKIGFATPEHNWLVVLKPWVEKTLRSDYARSLPVFKHHELITDWEKMLSGKSNFDFRFWRWINFIKWCELHQVEW